MMYQKWPMRITWLCVLSVVAWTWLNAHHVPGYELFIRIDNGEKTFVRDFDSKAECDAHAGRVRKMTATLPKLVGVANIEWSCEAK